MNTRMLLGALVLHATLVGTASAATFSITGGSAETITATCSPCSGGTGAPVGLTGYEGATATLSAATTLRFEFLGTDASDRNLFFAGTGLNPLFDTGRASNPTVDLLVTPSQFLQFLFTINSGAGGPTLGNGSGAISGGAYDGANIFYGIAGSTGTGASALRSGDTLILALTDGGTGCRPTCPLDNDHQDLAVRISTVPEPSTWAMMGLGLGMLGFMMRRRATRS